MAALGKTISVGIGREENRAYIREKADKKGKKIVSEHLGVRIYKTKCIVLIYTTIPGWIWPGLLEGGGGGGGGGGSGV
jgi:hypothetical protein